MATGNDVKFRVSVDTGDSKQDLEGLSAATDKAGNEAEQLGQKGAKGAAGVNQLGNSADAATTLLKNMAGTLAAGFTFQALVDAAARFEGIRSGLQAVTGDVERTNAELEFIRTTANRVGADINDVGRAFLGLSAAARGTAVEGEPTRQVFEAVANAMAKAGKSSADTEGALQAVAQIASKGTVSLEELRQQLSERLPGAMQAAAAGLGITTKELIELVETGQLAAEDLFPALAKGLNDLYGNGATGAQTLTQEITNIKNAFIELAAELGEEGGLNALKVAAEIAQAAIVSLDASLVATGKTIGVLAGAVASLDFSQLPQAFADIEKESRDKLLKAAQHNGTLRAAIEAMGQGAEVAAFQQRQAAQAAKESGDAAQGASGSFSALAVAYNKVGKEIQTQIETAEKSVIAREAEGKATVALAQAFGTEVERRQAAVVASQGEAQALATLAQVRQTEVEVLRAELAAKQAFMAQEGQNTEARRKEITELQQRITLRQAETDKVIAQASAARLAAEAAVAEAAAQADNSARVAELAKAYEAARTNLEQLQGAKAAGLEVTEQLKAAELEAGKAALLYRDALNDQVAALNAANAAKQADVDLQSTTVRLAIAQRQAALELARARGDEVSVQREANEIKRLEVQLLQLSAQAKRAEGQAQLAVTQAKRAELEASGQLTAAKRLELDAAEKKAQVLLKEAEIAEVTAKKMEDLRFITLASGDASNQAAKGFDNLSRSIDSTTGAIDRNTAAAQRNQAQASSTPANPTALPLDASGRPIEPGQVGNTGAVDNSGMFIARDKLRNGTLTAADIPLLEGVVSSIRANQEVANGSNVGAFSLEGQRDQDQWRAVAGQLEEQLRRLQTEQQRGQQQQATTTPQAVQPIVFNLGGRRTTVNVASRGDADALAGVLQQLETDATRT